MRNRRLVILTAVVMAAALAVGLVVAQTPYEKHFLALWDEVLEGLKASGWGVAKNSDVKAMMDAGVPVYLLDVRTAGEWEEGCISGAHHIALSDLMQPENVAKLPSDPEAVIVTYCKAGTRGDFALAALRHLGYTNSQNLQGGYLDWVDAEYPTATPEEDSDVCPGM